MAIKTCPPDLCRARETAGVWGDVFELPDCLQKASEGTELVASAIEAFMFSIVRNKASKEPGLSCCGRHGSSSSCLRVPLRSSIDLVLESKLVCSIYLLSLEEKLGDLVFYLGLPLGDRLLVTPFVEGSRQL